MILLFDVGNTNIKIGLAEGNEIKKVFRLNTIPDRTPDLYATDLHKLYDPEDIEAVAISSVVPEVTLTLQIISKRFYNVSAFVIGPGVKTGINIITDHPIEVGSDLICAAAAVKNPRPTVIVDLGTANKYIYVKDARMIGVIISPGVVLSLKALIGSTALLPEVNIAIPKKVLGTNTVHCMQSGVTYGAAAEVEGILRRIRKEINEEIYVKITGGLGKIIAPLITCENEVRPNLVLEGLLRIYHKNH